MRTNFDVGDVARACASAWVYVGRDGEALELSTGLESWAASCETVTLMGCGVPD